MGDGALSPGSATENELGSQLPGGGAVAALMLLASLGFRVYLAIAMGGNGVLGLLGGGLILLLWLYLLAVALLLGGAVNAVLVRRAAAKLPASPNDPTAP